MVTVVEADGPRLRLHFDGYSDSYDFWENANSENLFPVGWCMRNNQCLQPPKGNLSEEITVLQFKFRNIFVYFDADQSLAQSAGVGLLLKSQITSQALIFPDTRHFFKNLKIEIIDGDSSIKFRHIYVDIQTDERICFNFFSQYHRIDFLSLSKMHVFKTVKY